MLNRCQGIASSQSLQQELWEVQHTEGYAPELNVLRCLELDKDAHMTNFIAPPVSSLTQERIEGVADDRTREEVDKKMMKRQSMLAFSLQFQSNMAKNHQATVRVR